MTPSPPAAGCPASSPTDAPARDSGASPADQATQHKLNAIADGLADLMEAFSDQQRDTLQNDISELKAAVGLEERETTSHRAGT